LLPFKYMYIPVGERALYSVFITFCPIPCVFYAINMFKLNFSSCCIWYADFNSIERKTKYVFLYFMYSTTSFCFMNVYILLLIKTQNITLFSTSRAKWNVFLGQNPFVLRGELCEEPGFLVLIISHYC